MPPPFQRFLEEQRAPVLRYLRAAVGPQEADDLLQETFLSALRAYPRLRADSDLRAWVMTIARNAVRDAHRASGRRPTPAGDVAEDALAADGRDPTAGIEAAELWAAVRRLPDGQRDALALRFAADLPHAEVARALGCSEVAARRRTADALAHLREVLPA